MQELDSEIRSFQLSNNTGTSLCAITGVAGSGKSELAKAYGWKFHAENSKVFRWRLDPDAQSTHNNLSATSYQQAYSVLLKNFNLLMRAYDTENEEEMHQRLISTLWQNINQYPQWIVIFDNARSYDNIAKYLPVVQYTRGLVLITTQESNFLENTQGINFSINQGLDPNQAIQLFRNVSDRKGDTDRSIQTLLLELDLLPLGVTIAGGYLRKSSISVERYVEILKTVVHEKHIQQKGSNFLRQLSPDQQRTTTLERALCFSIDLIRQSNPLLFEILQYGAFLANENIPLDLLAHLCRTAEGDEKEKADDLEIMIQGPGNYSMLTYDTSKQCCSLHRCTQIAIRNSMGSRHEIIQKVVNVIMQVYCYDEDSMLQLKKCRQAEPHFLALLASINSSLEMTGTLATGHLQLLLILGQLKYESSSFPLALDYLQQAWILAQKTPDSDLQIQVEILRFLGLTQSYLLQYKEAETNLEKALELGKKCHGPNWRLARIYNTLADIMAQDASIAFPTVCKIYKHTIYIWRFNPPSKDLDLQVANSYAGIGSIKLDGQMQNWQRALEMYDKYLKPNHPSIASIHRDMAIIGIKGTNPEIFYYIGFGSVRDLKYSTCRAYLESSLAAYTAIYGPQSHNVADVSHWLSRLLYISKTKENWVPLDRECSLEPPLRDEFPSQLEWTIAMSVYEDRIKNQELALRHYNGVDGTPSVQGRLKDVLQDRRSSDLEPALMAQKPSTGN